MRGLGVLVAVVALAGCTGPAAEVAPPDGAASPAAGLVEEVTFDGRTEQVACAGTADERLCPVVQDAEDLMLAPGPVQRIQATFTWTPTGPADAELEAYLLAYDAEGEWQWEPSPDSFARGPPLLTVDWNAASLPFDYERLSLHMATAHRGEAGEARWSVGSGVAWRVEALVLRG